MAPRLQILQGIRAVLFDIYGTLLVSSAGELHPDPALREAIKAAHAASRHPFPEVDIREIHASLHPEIPPDDIENLALQHEQVVNPAAEMPGAAEVVRTLSSAGFQLGLVSNAQFYTVPVLEACLGASLTETGIDPALCRFSYLERRAKPDLFLFESVRDMLTGRGVPTACVLFVGNDVRNDIDPARAVGFRTALFAGDASSLRLRGRTPEECGADLILTNLSQLPPLLAPEIKAPLPTPDAPLRS